jgi:hypothetical protein
MAEAQENHNGTPAASFTVPKDPRTIAKVPATSSTETPTNTTPNNSSTPPGGSTEAGNAMAPITKDVTSDDGCKLNMDEEVADYNHDVKKEKDRLDRILSFKVGLNISGQYVTDYNTNVSSLFKEYLTTANDNNCNWPVQNPALLSTNYTL